MQQDVICVCFFFSPSNFSVFDRSSKLSLHALPPVSPSPLGTVSTVPLGVKTLVTVVNARCLLLAPDHLIVSDTCPPCMRSRVSGHPGQMPELS